MAYSLDRLAHQIQKELSIMLLNDIKDTKIGYITITEVRLTNDLSYATVYYSMLTDDPAKEKEVAEGLDKAKGMMRHLLGQTLTVYKVPELIFKRDTSVAYGSKIDKLINQVKKQDQERENKNK